MLRIGRVRFTETGICWPDDPPVSYDEWCEVGRVLLRLADALGHGGSGR